MQELAKDAYQIIAPLFSGFKHHTVIKSILSGKMPGRLYCDDPGNPKVAFAQFKHRAFLAGDPESMNDKEFEAFIKSEVFQNCRDWDVPLFRLAAEPQAWMDMIERSLADREPIEATYQCYQYQIVEQLPKTALPQGFSYQEVSRGLIETDFKGKQDLLEEMCSERESVDSFLAKSFGVVAFNNYSLAGWCLSEYNYESLCEIGIAVLPPYQKQGLAKQMTNAFINLAASKAIERILWHCNKSNEASWRTALSAGFTLIREEPVRMVFLDRALNAAVHGDKDFEKGSFHTALGWYEKALAQPSPQAWMAWNAACAAARCGKADLAFEHLNHAVDLGFSNLDHLVKSQHFNAMKQDLRWGELITRINRIIHK